MLRYGHVTGKQEQSNQQRKHWNVTLYLDLQYNDLNLNRTVTVDRGQCVEQL